MAIPPFPSQDLAKLVLGYLAEEQLMTAYDEFLQASPYLDALRNEYDRIFMTSLKNILAEYRAVKIYVETCKPFGLRKRLLQCYNLFEIVKFLIQNVDINKLNEQDHNVDKSSFTKNTITTQSNPIQSSSQCVSQIESTTLDSSVEATSLEDLPGNVTAKKKSMKVLDRDSRNPPISSLVKDDNEEGYAGSVSPGSVNTLHLSFDDGASEAKEETINNNPTEDLTKSSKPESVQKIEEFNNILNYVCNDGSAVQSKSVPLPISANITNQSQRVSTAGTFQDFTTGIHNSEKVNVPDSNTPCIKKAQAPFVRNVGKTFVNIGSINAEDLKRNTHLVLTVDSNKNNQTTRTIATPTVNQNIKLPLLNAQNREENKIKILSDVVVDKSYDNLPGRPKMPAVLSNATSTPFQMQTIVINGTPAYKNKMNPICAPNHNYTKDEIMAMPTIILVPATATATNTTDSGRMLSLPNRPKVVTVTTRSAQDDILKPLSIDVTCNIDDPCLNSNNESTNKQTMINEGSLVKTVEPTVHVSLPKENTLSTVPKTTTPQGLHPKRKSSSTPRRNSHVRVLDFTTPRRILTETIDEQISNANCTDNTEESEAVHVPCNKTEVDVENTAITDKVTTVSNVDSLKLNIDKVKENKVVRKKNWDEDLRVLIDSSTSNNFSPKLTHTTKGKTVKQKNKSDVIENAQKKQSNALSKVKSKKKNSKVSDSVEEVTPTNYVSGQKEPLAVKPCINIINSNDRSIGQENDKKQNKSNDRMDTPESERVMLQNAVGAKLNISDFLETPYKQVLYDIQMETPRFLGPDLPGEPLSDVKIMSIPTPLFLRGSNEKQATPSSYSSRPTDYSSGGSYYKPDDQDYIISSKILENPVTEGEIIKRRNDVILPKEPKINNEKDDKENKSTRPVRQCRKNVSYKNSRIIGKTKDPAESPERSSTSIDSYIENIPDNKVISRNGKGTTKSRKKPDANKNKNMSKKSKSPIKKESPKTFIKIKPRRITPTKEILGRKNRKLSESSQNKQQNRTNSKDGNVNSIAKIAPATKSLRKSSTPRKLDCTKSFRSDSSGHNSPETSKSKQVMFQEDQACSHEADIEQIPLRWFDNGSQDVKLIDKHGKLDSFSVNDSEDISKIKEYIETTVIEKSDRTDGEGSLHFDLIKRGFDIETAKSIERDLLDSPYYKHDQNLQTEALKVMEIKKNDIENKAVATSAASNLDIVDNDDEDSEEMELSIHECNEESENFITYKHDSSYVLSNQPAKLKEHFTMEICIDDGVTIRLRSTTFSVLFEQDPQEMDINYFKETEMAVSSISNIDKLYTPMKDHKAQVYDIFDSTLTSLDTPLKAISPKSYEYEPLVTEIALEVEKADYKEKSEVKKRKRLQSGLASEESNCNKKAKSDTQYLLNSTNIQNIDIESVLTKLHGP